MKFTNLGLALGLSLKFYSSGAKGLKLRVKQFCGLSPTFAEVTGEKMVVGGGAFRKNPESGKDICLRQALLFACCTGFKNSIYVFTKCMERFQRSIR